MIQKIYNEKKSIISFEVFPPKKEDDFPNAFSVLDQLKELNPEFISVTYGAGGSNSKNTVDIASYIENTLKIPALAHLTCVGNKKEDIDKVLKKLQAANVNHILALRGDRPSYMNDEVFFQRDFLYASDLITYIKNTYDFTIAGAAYPEKHFEATSMDADIQYLKEKTNCGLEFLITQLFFDNNQFYSFLEKARKANISIPISVGIMPITSAKQLGTTVTLSGSSVPKSLSDIIAKYGDSKEDMQKAGIDYAINQILDLKAQKVDGIHIYSMNKPKTTALIMNGIK
ncbi:MAG: methylenetetrahydrofolate reductase [NAD(P)H] [Lachnospiraceae bacterium]